MSRMTVKTLTDAVRKIGLGLTAETERRARLESRVIALEKARLEFVSRVDRLEQSPNRWMLHEQSEEQLRWLTRKTESAAEARTALVERLNRLEAWTRDQPRPANVAIEVDWLRSRATEFERRATELERRATELERRLGEAIQALEGVRYAVGRRAHGDPDRSTGLHGDVDRLVGRVWCLERPWWTRWRARGGPRPSLRSEVGGPVGGSGTISHVRTPESVIQREH